jgi:glycosyltransferase involved in cell wall biosynthesis
MNKPIIAIVVPCYNEQEALPATMPQLLAVLDAMVEKQMISSESYVLCSDDGSKDATWDVVEKLHADDARVKGISLAHNRGQQNALLAGLMSVRGRCDAAVTIDADLQDDPQAMVAMVDKFIQGDDIVYGVRSGRQTDTWFKRSTAHAFYSLQNGMGVEAVYDHADYRLMSSRALDLLAEYGEENLFLRGIVTHIGLKSSVVEYQRTKRCAGHSKYPLTKMLSFSIDGITSFSAKPMRYIFLTGLTFWLADVAVALWVLIAYFFCYTISGWASIMLSIWFLGSLILMAVGIVGEYIGKIFIEVKRRPRFAIVERIW